MYNEFCGVRHRQRSKKSNERCARKSPPSGADDGSLIPPELSEVGMSSLRDDAQLSLGLIAYLESLVGVISAKRLAPLLDSSEKLLYKHAAIGRIPSFRIGGLIRFCPAEVADWLRKRRVGDEPLRAKKRTRSKHS